MSNFFETDLYLLKNCHVQFFFETDLESNFGPEKESKMEERNFCKAIFLDFCEPITVLTAYL